MEKPTQKAELRDAKAMGLDSDEWEKLVEGMGRNPNLIETLIFSKYWSEDYSNKSSGSMLQTLRSEDQNDITLRLDAGKIRINQDYSLVLSSVSNNKECLKDSYFATQNALAKSIDAVTSFGAKPLTILSHVSLSPAETVKNRRVLNGIVSGLSNFSNVFGITNAKSNFFFNPLHEKAPVLNTSCVGIIEESAKPEAKEKDLVFYAGTPTGRESLPIKKVVKTETKKKTIEDAFLENAADGTDIILHKEKEFVQKVSDPLTSNLVANAFKECIENDLFSGSLLVSEAGLGTAILALAVQLNKALNININRIPVTDESIPYSQLLQSETTQRFLFVAKRSEQREIVKIFHKYDLDITAVGEVIDSDYIEYAWNRSTVASIPLSLAAGASIEQTHNVIKFPPMLKQASEDMEERQEVLKKRKKKYKDEWAVVQQAAAESRLSSKSIREPESLEDTVIDMLVNPNLCSKNKIIQEFDTLATTSHIPNNQTDAAVFKLRDRTLAVSITSCPNYLRVDPYLGTVLSIAESMRNLAAVGATPLAVADCLNFGDPSDYKDISDLSESIRGLKDSCSEWKIPIVSDYVSLYNGSKGSPSIPTPSMLVVGVVKDEFQAVSSSFLDHDDSILVIGETLEEAECSEYAQYCSNFIGKKIPDINFENEKKICEIIISLIKENLLKSCASINSGGIAQAVTKAALSRTQPTGATLELYNDGLRDDIFLFSETQGRFMISAKEENIPKIQSILKENDVKLSAEGKVGGKLISFQTQDEVSIPLATAYRVWNEKMPQMLGQAKTSEN